MTQLRYCNAKAARNNTWTNEHFGHLMQRTDSLEKTLMLGKIKGRRRREQQRMRWLDGITNTIDMSLSHWWWTGELAAVHGVSKSQTRLSDWTELNRMSTGGLVGKESACNVGDPGWETQPCVGKVPWRKAWQTTPVFFPGESHGQRSLYSPWGRKESDPTKRLIHTMSTAVLIKFYLQKQASNWIWPMGCSLPTPDQNDGYIIHYIILSTFLHLLKHL